MRARRGGVRQEGLPAVASHPAHGPRPRLRDRRRGGTPGARTRRPRHEQQERAVDAAAPEKRGPHQRGDGAGQGGVRAGRGERNPEGFHALQGAHLPGDREQRRRRRLRGHRGAADAEAGGVAASRADARDAAGDLGRGQVRKRQVARQRRVVRHGGLTTRLTRAFSCDTYIYSYIVRLNFNESSERQSPRRHMRFSTHSHLMNASLSELAQGPAEVMNGTPS
mmetsp:Transcript_13841/g.58610  ORF Transcript_13841/g.58610 Transcript_13841/m.58610 type:complete len:223 (+) Transcript_13841:778-1446(+)